MSSAASSSIPRLAARVCLAGLAALASVPVASAAAFEPERVASLADLSLEQLRDVVVTTVSRREQRLDRVAAAVYVITAEDIRRSGAATVPEALRLAPTLDVARADSSQYAISARGFNNVLANKMLVLIDGRTVYTPLFSGVFWEAQDVMLEDVERIEVVTGPSTALWGSNAVNGLIHIITRPAAGTQGAYGALRAGDRDRGAAARYGGALGDGGRFRAYARYYDRDSTHRADGSPIGDAAHGIQGGMRFDWGQAHDAATLQGDVYRGSVDQAAAGARHFSGGNVIGRWQRGFADGSEASVQVYADHTEREHPQNFAERLDTFDAVLQYAFKPASGHAMIVGGGHRYSRDRVATAGTLAFVPDSRSLRWSRLFVQDQIDLTPAVALTVSGSVEGNPYTGAEYLPGLRLGWTAAPGHLLWGAYSRAVRAPSRIDREFFVPAQPPFVLAGGPGFDAEISNVFELGYRGQSSSQLWYSLTLFDAEHRRLRSIAPTSAGPQFANDIRGFTRGVETWARWRVSERWRLDAGLVVQNQKLRVSAGAVDLGGIASLGNDPRRFVSIRSSLDLGPAWIWNLDVRRVGSRPAPDVPAYTSVDTRLAWRVNDHADLTFGVQNLLDRRHAEWGNPVNRAEIERSVFVQLRLQD
ncbi:MAG: TonB-dependent receptor [Caldimonas sp.]